MYRSIMAKKILVLGGGGFIGGSLVKRLMEQGNFVRSADLKAHAYGIEPNEMLIGDLSEYSFMEYVLQLDDGLSFDEIYQLAADMGGAGYIFTGINDANVMSNSISINVNLLRALSKKLDLKLPKIFYSSSACIYPEEIQLIPNNSGLRESDAYPANPDSEYGWEKLFSERIFAAYSRNFGFEVRIARFHNIYGPFGTWTGGREKAPAAVCRKIAQAVNGDEIEIWGDGEQTRSFLFIDDCLDAVQKLMMSDHSQPINIGSEEMVSINKLVEIVAKIANKELGIKHITGPQGVRGRNSNNDRVRKYLGWDSLISLEEGMRRTYQWIEHQVHLG
jgi:GDP-D-mannose 3',5'-epimerase